MILRKIYPGLLELYDELTAQADLSATVAPDNTVAEPRLTALAELAGTLNEPVTLPVKHSLLALLLSCHAPELADAKLRNLSLDGRAFQQRIDRLWLQYKQLECINSDQRLILEQQESEPKVDEIEPSDVLDNTQHQARPVSKPTLSGFERVYSSPAQMRMPERVALYSLIFGIQPRNCLEIGTARGGSAAIISGAMDDLGFGQLSCVDPMPQVDPVLWAEISNRCTMFEGTSPGILPKALEAAGAKFDFALIDGDHNFEAVCADIANVLPYLTDDAYVLFHDAHNEGVKRAIDEAVSSSKELIDCGLMSVERTILQENGHCSTWAGLRLLRFRRSALSAAAIVPQGKAIVEHGPPLRRTPVILAGMKCLSGVTTWAERLREELAGHPRYDVRLLHIGRERAPGYDLYAANVDEARELVRGLGPAILVPNYVWELYLEGSEPGISCLGICHSNSLEEYYLPLTWYESKVAEFIAVSPECAEQLAERIPFRAKDIATLPYGVRVPQELNRIYKTDPVRIIYAGRLIQGAEASR